MSEKLKKINTLTVWKSKKSLGTCVTLVSIKARLARTFSNVITVVTYWSACITIARYKRQKINIHIISYGRMKGFLSEVLKKDLPPWQFGNPKNPPAHLLHLLPKICADLQMQCPSLSSQLVPWDPSELQLHPIN